MQEKTKGKKGLSRAQLAAFWRAVGAVARERGFSAAEKEEYRKQVILEETGKESLKDVGRTYEFERVLARVWADAGDFRKASWYTGGDEKRVLYNIKVCAAQIMQLKGGWGTQGASEYVAGVLRQSGMCQDVHLKGVDVLFDLPPLNALRVFQMLDTHRRRLLKELKAEGSRLLAFSDKVRYIVTPPILTVQGVEKGYYTDRMRKGEI